MSLIQPLPRGSLDIVGDIHGEYDALCQLLTHFLTMGTGRLPKVLAPETACFTGRMPHRYRERTPRVQSGALGGA